MEKGEEGEDDRSSAQELAPSQHLVVEPVRSSLASKEALKGAHTRATGPSMGGFSSTSAEVSRTSAGPMTSSLTSRSSGLGRRLDGPDLEAKRHYRQLGLSTPRMKTRRVGHHRWQRRRRGVPPRCAVQDRCDVAHDASLRQAQLVLLEPHVGIGRLSTQGGARLLAAASYGSSRRARGSSSNSRSSCSTGARPADGRGQRGPGPVRHARLARLPSAQLRPLRAVTSVLTSRRTIAVLRCTVDSSGIDGGNLFATILLAARSHDPPQRKLPIEHHHDVRPGRYAVQRLSDTCRLSAQRFRDEARPALRPCAPSSASSVPCSAEDGWLLLFREGGHRAAGLRTAGHRVNSTVWAQTGWTSSARAVSEGVVERLDVARVNSCALGRHARRSRDDPLGRPWPALPARSRLRPQHAVSTSWKRQYVGLLR